MSKYLRNSAIIAAAALIGITGCSTKEITSSNGQVVELQKQIDEKDAQISQLEAQNRKAMSSINAMNSEAKDKNAVSNSLVPPNAKAGECYAKVLVPAKYETKKVRKMLKEARTNIKITPATYKTVNKSVTVKEATTKLIPVAATYKTITETIMVEPEKTKLVTVPATYKTVTEKILIKPAYTTWKKGRGEIEKIDNSTGDILCLVEVPAEYKTVKSKVIDTPATTKEVKIPAVYKTVKRKVVDKPATTKEVVIPAVSKNVKTRVLATQATENKVEIPAVYTMVPTKVKVADSYLRWQSILCETNTTSDVIAKLQRELNKRGYKSGPVDGAYGPITKSAVKAYQRKNNMNEGALTLKTLQSLGIM